MEADVALVEADVDMPLVEAEAEAVPMVVGAGRLHHQLEALAADGTSCRPLRFRSCNQLKGLRARELSGR